MRGSGAVRDWRSLLLLLLLLDMDMDAASLDESSWRGSGASLGMDSGEGGAVDSSGDSARADSNSGSKKWRVSGKKSEAITTR